VGQQSKLSSPTKVYNYDKNGNLLTDGTRIFVYDAFNRMVKVLIRADNTEIAKYGYDAFGNRVLKTVDNITTRFIYSGKQVIEEYEGDILMKSYIYGTMGLDDVVKIRTNSNDYYYHKDILGSVVALTDDTGGVVEKYEYDAYGKTTVLNSNGVVISASTVGNDFGYTGQRADSETGLYYYKARYYSPELGRFLNQDPIGYKDSMNLYAYVNDNPVNFVDPSGEVPNLAQDTDMMRVYNDIRMIEIKREGASKEDIISSIKNEFASGYFGNPNGFIYTEKEGWIDMQHFWNTVYYSNMIGSISRDMKSEVGVFAVGYLVEALQFILSMDSGFSYEDVNSNYLGAIFYRDSISQENSDKKVSDLFHDFIMDLNPMPPEEAPNYNNLPEYEETFCNSSQSLGCPYTLKYINMFGIDVPVPAINSESIEQYRAFTTGNHTPKKEIDGSAKPAIINNNI